MKWILAIGLLLTIFLSLFWFAKIPPAPESLAMYRTSPTEQDWTKWIQGQEVDQISALLMNDILAWLDTPKLPWYRMKNEDDRELFRALKQLMAVIQASKQGETGKSAKLYQTLVYEWKDQRDHEGESKARIQRQALALSHWLTRDIIDTDSGYRMKQKFEDFRIEIASTPSEALIWRLLSLQSRLEESQKALEQDRLEESVLSLSITSQGLTNAAHDMEYHKRHWTTEEANQFAQAWSQLSSKAQWLDKQILAKNLEQQDAPILTVTTSTISIPTSTEILPVVATTTDPVIDRISVIPGSQAVSFGQTIGLRVFAVYDSGDRKDVTNDCSFSVSPPEVGNIDKQRFGAYAIGGGAVISAQCRIDQKVYTGSTAITIGF